MLEAFNYLDKNIEFGSVENKPASEAAVHKTFLQENFSFYSNSKSKSNFSSQIDSGLNFDDIDSDDSNSNDKNTSQYSRNNSYINSCNSIYAQEKLVKILAGEMAILKQREDIDKILAILTYHQKDYWLRFSYCRFKQFCLPNIFSTI